MSERSQNFEKVKMYYKNGFWSEAKVKMAVTKGWITEDECKEIIGG